MSTVGNYRRFPMMRSRFVGFIALAAMAFVLAGCEPSTNDNANVVVNANKAANANTAVVNSNANTNSRKEITREDYEKEKAKYQKEAKDTGRRIGTGLNDGWLWTKTRFDLAAADDLRDSTINVDLNDSVVTLTGTVASGEQKTRAQAIAKSVEGVTSVKNLLKVKANTNSNTANSNTPKKKG
jgi:hyperosmotically inducible protein